MIAAGIVLYNPQIGRLLENITAITPQVDLLVLVDNGSSNIIEVQKALNTLEAKYVLIENDKNKGIACALNQLMDFARNNGAIWVLTLDQDSVCPSNLIESLSQYSNLDNIGIICPVIRDRSFGIFNPKHSSVINELNVCITSASLTNVEAWYVVGGFDDTMFIDGVDTDFCLTLREHGYRIVQCNGVELIHEIGHSSKIVTLFGRRQVVFNHSAIRYFYMCRNIIYNNRKHPGYRPSPMRGLLTIGFRWLLTILFEKKRMKKTILMVKGVIEGFRVPINYQQNS